MPISSPSGIWSSNSGSTLAGSLEPVALAGAQSTSRFSGPSARRQGIWTVSVFCRRHKVVSSGTAQSRVRQLQQAGHHPSRLPRRHCRSDQWRNNGNQLEQDLDRQTELDRCIQEHRWAARAPVMRRKPGHVLVQPDQQRTAPPQRRSVAGPVRRAVAGRGWLAHAPRLTAWIHDVNPPPTELCNMCNRPLRKRDLRSCCWRVTGC